MSAQGASTIQFGKGITLADITSLQAMTTNGGGGLTNQYLVINIGGGSTSTVPAGRIQIQGFDFGNPGAPLPVATLRFADNSEVKLANLLAASGVNTTGTTDSEAIQGIWRAETLAGGEGDDMPTRGCDLRIARVRSPEGWNSIPSCTTVPGLSQYFEFERKVSLQYLARFSANPTNIHNERLAA